MSATRVAVVTGSNKGIGLATVEILCQRLGENWNVYLTARDAGRGQEAVKTLEAKGCHPQFHQLDICSLESLQTFAKYLKEKYGGLDILVNNAGIAYKRSSTAPAAEQAEVTVRTNFTATLDACKILFPLLRPHARVVHLSSESANYAFKKCSADLRKTMTSPMSMDELVALMDSFVQAVKDGTDAAKGWASWKYAVSKMGVTIMTKIQQKELDNDPREDLVVNCCCPGLVQTDMSGGLGKLPKEGAKNPVYLALLPPGVKTPRGEFIENDQQVTEWK